MKLPKDILSGTTTPPSMFLAQADKTIIGGLNYVNGTLDAKFNEYTTLSCEVDRVIIDPITGDTRVNPLYDKVEALRVLYVVDYGYFQIISADITSDGIREYKSVTTYSLEYELTQKYLDTFLINQGTTGSIDGVQLYNVADISKSLIHLVLEKMPGWSVGHVDIGIQDRKRAFEVDHTAIYDFLMNDMAESFQIVVKFDTYERSVNLYDEETAGHDTDIYVSLDTIANNVQIQFSADDIKTCLYAYGSDDLGISEVNVGQPYILNIDYYNTPEWLGQDLYDAYNAYVKKVNGYREQYTDLMKQWREKSDELSELYNAVPDYLDENDDGITVVHSKDELPIPSQEYVYQVYKVDEYTAVYYYVCHSKIVNNVTTYFWELDVDKVSSFFTFPYQFTDDNYANDYTNYQEKGLEYVDGVFKVYNEDSKDGVLYYICKSYHPTDASGYPDTTITKYKWVLASTKYGINLLKEKEEVYLQIQEVQVSNGMAEKDSRDYNRYLENYNRLTDVQAQLKEEQAKADELQKQINSITSQMSEISKEIQISNNLTPEQIKNLNPFIREDEFSDDSFLVTDIDTYASRLAVQEALLEAAAKELAKISQPQLTFSMDMANIMAIPEFEPMLHDFELGNSIFIEIRPDYVRKAQILEINVNFDDPSDFSVVFGNLTALYDQIDIHAALLSQAVSAGKSVAESSSYWKKGADTATSINQRIENGLIDALTSIKTNSENQAVSFDNHGIHLRKWADSSMTDYMDNQVWMNNEQIVFTDDNWRTAKMALGSFNDPNLGECWGIIAPNVVGTLLAGQNLVIDSTKPDGTLSSFRVDANGARLYNSQFLLQNESEDDEGNKIGGKIIIDPSYGIIAGTKDLYTTDEDGNIIPSFVDQNTGAIKKDKDLLPLNANFYLDSVTGQAYFRGTVYATGGYFDGSVESNSGYIGGWSVDTGILYSGNNGNFVALSSNNKLADTTNKTKEATDYAIWAGAVDPAKAPFSVKRDGTLHATKGTFSGNLEAAGGSFTGSINVNDNFTVDSNGNMYTAGIASIGGTCDIGANTTIDGNLKIYGTYGIGKKTYKDNAVILSDIGTMGYMSSANDGSDGVGLSCVGGAYVIATGNGVRMQGLKGASISTGVDGQCAMTCSDTKGNRLYEVVVTSGGCYAVDYTTNTSGEWTSLFTSKAVFG